MNIKKWKSILGFVTLEQYPNLPCPYCHQETLNLDESSIVSRVVSENYKNIASRHFSLEQEKQKENDSKQGDLARELWSSNSLLGVIGVVGLVVYQMVKPSYHFCKFTAFMKCTSCGDNVAVTGLSQEHTKKANEQQLPSLYKIDHFSIPVPMFKINEFVPASIQFELLGAFHYFHIDTNSSANKLRRAIENFCTELGFKANNLARQIELLKKEYPTEAEFLNTLRLVGNEGTHSDGVIENDLLLAFDIVKEVLEIFPRLDKLQRLMAPQKILIDKFDKKKSQVEPKALEHTK